jgi:hypothetical protein
MSFISPWMGVVLAIINFLQGEVSYPPLN